MPNFSNANYHAVSTLEKVSNTVTSGVPGSSIYGGFLQENEKNQNLVGDKKYITYSDILANVSIVGAGVRYFLNIVGNAEWRVESADESPEARRMADEIELIKDSLNSPWNKVIKKAATYKFYGFSIQEWTAVRMESGLIGIGRVDPRPQSTIHRWERDELGDVSKLWQLSPQDFKEIGIERRRVIYIVDDALNDSPEGLGIFRHIAEPARRLQRYEQLEGFSFETDLKGIPIARAPFALLEQANKTDAEKAALLKPLKTFMNNHIKTKNIGLMLDSLTYPSLDEASTPSQVKQWDIELLSSTSSSQNEVGAAIKRITETLARLLNVEVLLLGSGPNGTRSLGDTQTDNLAMVIESTLTEIEQVYNKDFIEVVGVLNGWNPKLLPKFKHEPVRFKSVEEITRALSEMSRAGAFLTPDDPAINFVRKLMSVPEQKMDDVVLDSSLGGNRTTTTPDIENTGDDENVA